MKKTQLVLYKKSKTPAIKIIFPFDWETVDFVKTIPGRKFHNDSGNKFWTCPLNKETVTLLEKAGFDIDPKIKEELHKTENRYNTEIKEIEIPGLQKPLFPFQKIGVAFIESRNGRALLSDDMGLGKSAQTLAWLQLHPEKRPAIIVCPASLKLNWEKEAKMWMKNPKIQILSGKIPNTEITGNLIIINYDILQDWIGTLTEINPQVLVLDESHMLKNRKTKRTKAVQALAKNIPHIIALSGTPIVNRPIELYNTLKLIDKTCIPNFWEYATKYCNATYTKFGWDLNGASNTEELHKILTSTIMIRRKKEDVLSDLPDKIRSFVPIEIDNEQEYRHAETDFIDWLLEKKGVEAAKKASNAEQLAKLEALKQLAVKGKLKQAIEWIETFLENNNKLVVFATHKNTIDYLMNKFKNISVKIDGSVSMENRNKAVQEFQNNDKIRLFVGNIKAAGVGLTLTAANAVAFLELDWVVGNHTQAEDRVHRIGQKNAVTVYYLIAAGTIEEEMAKLLNRKAEILASVLDGKSIGEGGIFDELLDVLKTKGGTK